MANVEQKVSKKARRELSPAQKARRIEIQRKARAATRAKTQEAKLRTERSKTFLGRMKNRWDDLLPKMK